MFQTTAIDHASLPPQGISLEAIEKELILKALAKFKWNQTHAAKYLDISRKALIYRMEKHGIERADSGSSEGELEEERGERLIFTASPVRRAAIKPRTPRRQSRVI